jgi:undecaprenyl diphosphate synthase
MIKEQIDLNKLPRHVAIIMDGNGRWAKKQGKLRVFGHQNGVLPVREVTEAAAELGIEFITLYAFSTENWNRPKSEVQALMSLLISTINKEVKVLQKNNIRLQTIGDLNALPAKSRDELLRAVEATSGNTRLTLVLALSYGSRFEIIEATKKIALAVTNNLLKPSEITEEFFESNLMTHNTPHPELMIRTSGEMRISNFLLWQLAYAELYFTPVLWPDFKKDDFYKALLDYQNRERRFGKTSEQIES